MMLYCRLTRMLVCPNFPDAAVALHEVILTVFRTMMQTRKGSLHLLSGCEAGLQAYQLRESPPHTRSCHCTREGVRSALRDGLSTRAHPPQLKFTKDYSKGLAVQPSLANRPASKAWISSAQSEGIRAQAD